MRAIDADELLKLIPPEEVCSRFAVKNAPTIEPQRKTGKWIDGYKRQTCSVCKQKGYRSWNFCPNCGAKMKGDKNENKNS